MQGGGGIVIAKDRSTGAWSAPCAVGLAGISFGAQCGAELNEVVLILRNAAAVEIFSSAAQVAIPLPRPMPACRSGVSPRCRRLQPRASQSSFGR